ncbi:hypothetical protein CP965_01845 [Halarcobacter mediterraneus]|uniref:Cobalt ABC transporter permease n=1 Tax=Halarcobacter mediterraneus TaxID=2023153 RepID=A0A4Q1AVK0_9BACT|nr:hypothetical protein [Halarcobacter mediterraneus]RXK14214.1 hypothetical protein CP965_01845 [Halarcobacter mediterraneus]
MIIKILIALFLPLFLWAHSLSATAAYEDGELFIEAYFSDGSPCHKCSFTLKKSNEIIYSGKLDDKGFIEEKVQLKAPFTIYVDGGMGHQGVVSIEALEEDLTENEIIENNETKQFTSIDEATIRSIVRGELNKQNTKIEAMIEKNKSTLEKMLVGLGYILGIFGIWQLFVRKKQ